MTNKNLKTMLEQMAGMVRGEINTSLDYERQVQLQDAMEYLRRAWHSLDGSSFEDNQTSIEVGRAMKS